MWLVFTDNPSLVSLSLIFVSMAVFQTIFSYNYRKSMPYLFYGSLRESGLALTVPVIFSIVILLYNYFSSPREISLTIASLHVAILLILLRHLFKFNRRRLKANIKKTSQRFSLADGLEQSEKICTVLRASSVVEACSPCSSVRRHETSVGDVEIIAAAFDENAVIQLLFSCVKNWQGWECPTLTYIGIERTPKVSICRKDGLKVSLRIVRPSEYGSALIDMSGRYHCDAIRIHALRMGGWLSFGPERKEYKFSEAFISCLTTRRPTDPGPLESELDVYERLGLQYIPSQMRNRQGIIDRAFRGELDI
jgi:hypothetical protein